VPTATIVNRDIGTDICVMVAAFSTPIRACEPDVQERRLPAHPDWDDVHRDAIFAD
jgi:hypothetical protein